MFSRTWEQNRQTDFDIFLWLAFKVARLSFSFVRTIGKKTLYVFRSAPHIQMPLVDFMDLHAAQASHYDVPCRDVVEADLSCDSIGARDFTPCK